MEDGREVGRIQDITSKVRSIDDDHTHQGQTPQSPEEYLGEFKKNVSEVRSRHQDLEKISLWRKVIDAFKSLGKPKNPPKGPDNPPGRW